MSERERLSKTKYCNGLQCPKMLWMKRNKPDMAEEVMNESVLANGRKVGDLARGYFGDYANAEIFKEDGSQNIAAMITKTSQLMAGETENIAEASFSVDGLYCAVDILHRNGDGWDIVEVKSSTKVSDVYIEDVSFQYYVLQKCGVNVKKAFLMHVNSGYVRQGALDIQKFFTLEEYTDVCVAKQTQVEENINNIRDYLNVVGEPVREIGVYCEKPYLCPFYKYCRGEQPEHSILDLHSKVKARTKYALWEIGLKSFEDVYRDKTKVQGCKDTKLNVNQWQEIESTLGLQKDVINKEKIQEFLDTLSYPVYHLDFETFQEAVPSFDGERPFQQVPFQYSLHIEYEDGRIEHKEFLAEEGTDPRRTIAESLCENIPVGVCCTAYFMRFECERLQELAELFPDLKEHLLSIRDNMHDLFIPFGKRDYYTASMAGKASIKNVLPALWPNDPDLDYTKLDGVHRGDEASEAFATLVGKAPDEIAKIREQLLKYCGLDTLAMVKVLQKLREAVKN